MINEIDSGPKNVQSKRQKLYHSKRLGHVYYHRKNLCLIDVAVFAEERFDKWKKGTDFQDIEEKYHIRCQLKLNSKTSNLENLTVIVNCTRDCHQEKNQATDAFGEPASIALSTSTSEDSKEDDAR